MAKKKKTLISKRIIHRKPFLSLDSTWLCRWKDLWTPYAGPNETYTGYISYWDEVPWQRVMFDDGHERDHNFAAQAQYMPSYGGSGDYLGIYDRCVAVGLPEEYCHNCVGLVNELIDILEADGIAESEITAAYRSIDGLLNVKSAPLHDLLFRNFDRANNSCPIVFSRPMTYHLEGAGHICDNAQQESYCRAEKSCDGTTGMFGSERDDNFRADAIWFQKSFLSSLILGAAEGHHDAKLVVYIIAAGSVPRIKINDTWYFTDPERTISYGDPYGFCFRGCRAVIESPNLLWGEEASNSIIVEHIAPRPECVGAQVIFCFEWTEILTEEVIMPEKKKKPPRKGHAIGDYFARWNQMIAAMQDEVVQSPHMQPTLDELTQGKLDVEALDAEQEILKGQLSDKTRELEAKIKEINGKYVALRSLLEAKYGMRAPELKKFISASQAEVDKTKEGWEEKKEEQKSKPK